MKLRSSRDLTPQWGGWPPALKAEDELALAGSVTVRTEEARCALIDPMLIEARAVTDTGEQLSSLPRAPYSSYRVPGSQDRPGPFGVNIRFPLPKPGTQRLSKVEGALREYVTVKVTAVDIPTGSVGQEFSADDIRVHVDSWETQYGKTHILLSAHRPSLAPPPPSTPEFPAETDNETGRIYTKPGGIGCVFVSPSHRPGSPDCTLTVDFTQNDLPGPRDADLNVLPAEIDHLRVLFYRYGAEIRDIPFVLTNIPLP